MPGMRITIDPQLISIGGARSGLRGASAPPSMDWITDDRSSSWNVGLHLSADGFQDGGLKEAAEGLQHESVDFPLNDPFHRVGP